MLRTLRRHYVHHRNRLLKGYQELAILIGIGNTLMLVWLTLRNVFGISNHYIWILPALAACALSLMYLCGYIWDRGRFFDEDNLWFTQRGPYIREIYEYIKEQKEKNANENR